MNPPTHDFRRNHPANLRHHLFQGVTLYAVGTARHNFIYGQFVSGCGGGIYRSVDRDAVYIVSCFIFERCIHSVRSLDICAYFVIRSDRFTHVFPSNLLLITRVTPVRIRSTARLDPWHSGHGLTHLTLRFELSSGVAVSIRIGMLSELRHQAYAGTALGSHE